MNKNQPVVDVTMPAYVARHMASAVRFAADVSRPTLSSIFIRTDAKGVWWYVTDSYRAVRALWSGLGSEDLPEAEYLVKAGPFDSAVRYLWKHVQAEQGRKAAKDANVRLHLSPRGSWIGSVDTATRAKVLPVDFAGATWPAASIDDLLEDATRRINGNLPVLNMHFIADWPQAIAWLEADRVDIRGQLLAIRRSDDKAKSQHRPFGVEVTLPDRSIEWSMVTMPMLSPNGSAT